MNAFIPGVIPMNGSTRGYRSAHIIPATAARAEPSPNARAIILLTDTPIILVVSMSNDIARIARPGFVQYRSHSNTPTSANATTGTRIPSGISLTPPESSMGFMRIGG